MKFTILQCELTILGLWLRSQKLRLIKIVYIKKSNKLYKSFPT